MTPVVVEPHITYLTDRRLRTRDAGSAQFDFTRRQRRYAALMTWHQSGYSLAPGASLEDLDMGTVASSPSAWPASNPVVWLR
jgi:hypothetical protein